MKSSAPRLRDILTITKDGEWGRAEPAQGFTPMKVIRGTDFDDVRRGNLDDVPIRYIPDAIAARKSLKAFDILIETAGGTKGRPTGRTLLITPSTLTSSSLPLTCASFARFMRPNKDLVQPEYLYWSLQNLYLLGEMEQHQVQHTGVARFQYTRFAETISFTLPPDREQLATISILSSIEAKIEHNRSVNATLAGLCEEIFNFWFVLHGPTHRKILNGGVGPISFADSLFPKAFVNSELGQIPEGWAIKPISDLAEIVGGSTPSTSVASFWGGPHAWATPRDLSTLENAPLLSTQRTLSDDGLAKIGSGLLPVGTVLLSSRAPIGYLAIAEVPVAINQGFIAMKPRPGVSNLFLWQWAKSAYETIFSRANGSTFLEISKSNFRPIQVITPPREIMQAFDDLIRPLYDRIVLTVQETLALVSLRDTLLPKLISGDLQSQNVDASLEKSA